MKIFIVFAFLLTLVFAQNSQAQNDQYPNQLKGYEFFGKGKLDGLKLGVSTKENVRKIFGRRCQSFCDYDTDWTIRFSYYENMWTKENTNEKNEKLVYYLDSKYLGKLRKIELRPKKQISLAGISFSNAFQKFLRTSISNTRAGKSRMITYDLFQDSYGLTYELFGATEHDDIKTASERSFNKGDLFSIQYNISKDLEKQMFIQKSK